MRPQSNLDNFNKSAVAMSQSPLGIIGLFLVLVNALTVVGLIFADLNVIQRYILIGYIIALPIGVLVVFIYLVVNHSNKLYSPKDFAESGEFIRALELSLKTSPTINEIQKAIYEQPLYKYTKLKEEGQVLIITLHEEKKVLLESFVREQQFNQTIVEQQIMELVDYGWIQFDDNTIKITTKGNDEFETFRVFIYARWG